MLNRNSLLAIGFLFLLVAVSTGAAQAQGGDLEKEAREIAKSLNCPVCQGLTLYECPLQVCEDWRNLIRQKLSAGETREEIIQYFVDQYGEQVLNAPRPQGFNWLVWILPFLALGAGGIWVALILRNLVKRRQEAAESTTEAGLEEYLQQVEKELEGWK
ncbi:MAG: cytochrome c-type biogenesis protein CcmH [Chloroflexi bacterium]|nr:cytochrome c-type biogenesis protein CcmH [Chloroflexota bacterium]